MYAWYLQWIVRRRYRKWVAFRLGFACFVVVVRSSGFGVLPVIVCRMSGVG